MKVLAIVFIVAAFALLIGAFSPGVEAPGCGGCSICAGECVDLGSPAQCVGCCISSGCGPTASGAICSHGRCEA